MNCALWLPGEPLDLGWAPEAGGPQASRATGLFAIPRPDTAAPRIRPARISSSMRGTPVALCALAGLGVAGTTSSPRGDGGGKDLGLPAIAPPRPIAPPRAFCLRSMTV
eukprot:6770118-Alexandrium_andersonii.AAC.1